MFYKIGKGVAIVSGVICLQMSHLRNQLSCEHSLVWRDSCLGCELWLRFTMQGDCEDPCLALVQEGKTSRSRNQSLLRQRLLRVGSRCIEAHCTSKADGTGCIDTAIQLPALRKQLCKGRGQPRIATKVYVSHTWGKGEDPWLFLHCLWGMPRGGLRRDIALLEGLLLPFGAGFMAEPHIYFSLLR